MSNSLNLTATIGGRLVTPALPTVDSSPSPPSELLFNDSLTAYISHNVPLESLEGIQRRERVLMKMASLCREWVKSVARKRGWGEDMVERAGGELFTSGSYRLGVHEPGADIDTIVVAPNICTRDDFFGSNYIPPNTPASDDTSSALRDPSSLAERIRVHPDVTNFVPVENAAVPILTFDWEGINIDLLFARLNASTVPPNFDIDNDSVLSGVDSATEKSLNGPRVTNLIAALVSGTKERYQTFLTVVRLVRKWAKNRGLYSNKMGYWGGVNINIAVALTLQLYPNACPASLLRKFFLVFKSWRWPNPILLTKPHDAELGLPVWNALQATSMRQVAPMITPAYPAMNSTLSVSRQTLQILHEEFCRGHNVVDKLYKDFFKGDVLDKDDVESGDIWKELFQPSDFFIGYPHYLSLCIVGPSQADAQAWAGFVESRLRKLVSDMMGRSLPLSKIQLWPKKFDACVADRTALLTHVQRANSITYFIGFRVDTLRMRGNQLDIERQLSNFRNYELSKFYPLVPGMDILPRTFAVKELPKICFEGMYEGGKIEAMKRRRLLIEADPKRQEAKAKKKLAKLKKKMEVIQQRQAQSAVKTKDETEEANIKIELDESLLESRKRKRDDDDAEGEDANLGGDEEEAALLESALDKIQDDSGPVHKTREEAEIDRQKLLAGLEWDEDEDAGVKADEEAEDVKIDPSEQKSTSQEREAEILRRSGLVIVSDDETTMIGGNRILPWRQGYRSSVNAVKKEENGNEANDKKHRPAMKPRVAIKFKTQFDIVELDANGRVIDKGDDDYMPSAKWIGRKGGFEYKLGERGLGYYRTGKKVVVPSNVSYA